MERPMWVMEAAQDVCDRFAAQLMAAFGWERDGSVSIQEVNAVAEVIERRRIMAESRPAVKQEAR